MVAKRIRKTLTPRAGFTTLELLRWTSLVAILIILPRSSGCGHRHSRVECISFSPDGQQLAVSVISARGSMEPRRQHVFAHEVERDLSIFPTGARTSGRKIYHEALRHGSHVGARYWERWHMPNSSRGENSPRSMTFVDDQCVVATNWNDGSLVPIYLDQRGLSRGLPLGHSAYAVERSPSGKLVAVVGRDGLSILDAMTLRAKMSTRRPFLLYRGGPVMSFTEDDSHVLVGSLVSTIECWNVSSPTQLGNWAKLELDFLKRLSQNSLPPGLDRFDLRSRSFL